MKCHLLYDRIFSPPLENKKKFPREVTRGSVLVHGAMLFTCVCVCVSGFVGVVVSRSIVRTVYLSCDAPEEACILFEGVGN